MRHAMRSVAVLVVPLLAVTGMMVSGATPAASQGESVSHGGGATSRIAAAPVPASPTLSAPAVAVSYSCILPVIGAMTFSGTVSGVAPASVLPGSPVTVSSYQASIELSASLVNDLLQLGGKSPLTGDIVTEDVAASNATPSLINATPTPQPLSVPFSAGQPAFINAPAVSVGPFSAGQSGVVTFQPGTFAFAGDFPVIGRSTVTCVPVSPVPTVATTAIIAHHTPLTILTTDLPPGRAGLAYSETLSARGGTAPYRWQLVSGVLPGGIRLSEGGVLSGVPEAASDTALRFSVTDSASPPATVTSATLHLIIGTAQALPTVQAWGASGPYGSTSAFSSAVPTVVGFPPGTDIVSVSAGADFMVALTSTGSLYAWGANDDGQLGDGSTASTDRPTLVQLPAGTTVRAVSAGGYHCLALTTSGTVWAWGANMYGQVGNGTTVSTDVPGEVSLPAGVTIVSIAAGGVHSLAVSRTGTVYGWGRDLHGELGDGGWLNRSVPVAAALPPSVVVKAVAAGGAHSLALTSTGAVYSWGFDGSGRLGAGSFTTDRGPLRAQLPAGLTATAVAAGAASSAALMSNGSVYDWGYNGQGQLGNGSRQSSDLPVKAGTPSGVRLTKVAAGAFDTVALGSGGAVYAWGDNADGQLGDGTTTNRATPVRSQLAPTGRAIFVGSGPNADATMALVIKRSGV